MKCDNSREMFAARTWAIFILHCDEGAIFHVCLKANISHPASAGYFTETLSVKRKKVLAMQVLLSFFVFVPI